MKEGQLEQSTASFRPAVHYLNGRVARCLALVAILATAFSLYTAVRSPYRFGAYYDDGLYVVAAKALATGQGYSLISLPQEKPQTLYPPFYSFLLSLIWRMAPEFPQNLSWMMLLSVASMIAYLGLTYSYLTTRGYASGWHATVVIGLAAINWRTMLLASALISDMIYAVLSVIALQLSESDRDKRRSPGGQVLVGFAIGLAFLTRTSGIALLGAFLFYKIRNQWRSVLLPTAIGGIMVLGWITWTYLNQGQWEGINAAYYSGYLSQVKNEVRLLNDLSGSSTLKTFFGIVSTNTLMLVVGSIPLACLGLRYDLPPTLLVSTVLLALFLLAIGITRHVRAELRLLHVYVAAYLALHLITPGTGYDRYMLPLVPFLLLFLTSELREVFSRIRINHHVPGLNMHRVVVVFVSAVLFSFIAIAVYSNLSGIRETLRTIDQDNVAVAENREAFEWIKAQTLPSDVIACYRDQVCYLYTDRKAVVSFPLILFNSVTYHPRPLTIDEQVQPFLTILRESRARYLLLNAGDFEYESRDYRENIANLVKQQNKRFICVFKSGDGRALIYRIEPAGDTL